MAASKRIPMLMVLLFTAGSCASGPEEVPLEKRLEAGRIAWEKGIQEDERTAKQRAAILPDLLDVFAEEDIGAWKQSKSTLDLLEKKQKGFVYDRVLVLLPGAMKRGGQGESRRAELVQIGRIIRTASRFHSGDPEEWKKARVELTNMGSQGVDAAAVRLIVKLRTQDPRILHNVQSELVAMGPGAVRHLVLALRSARVGQFIKDRCVDVLARIGTSTMPALLPLLEKDQGRGARYYGAKTLGKLGDPGAAEKLAAAEGRETDPFVRCVMLEALGSIGGPEAEGAATRALGAEDLSVVKFGARTVSRLDASGSVHALIAAL
ncbi:MAG: HEAT repeat domain-containing protein, partial [Planctomycetota bacterium]